MCNLINGTMSLGATTLHTELEQCVAGFVAKSTSVVFGMGYVTNSAIIGKIHPITSTRIFYHVLHLCIVLLNQFGCKEV